MTWLTWRLHWRTGLAVALTALAFVALLTYLAGELQTMAAAAGSECATAFAGLPTMCSDELHHVFRPSQGPYATMAVLFRFSFAALPALLGAFIGAPLLAREFEERTHRLAWTQGISRRRWFGTKLGLALLVVSLATGAVGILALFDAYFFGGGPWLTFDYVAPVFVAHTVFAVALGVAAGAILRNTVGAMLTTIVGFTAAFFLATLRRMWYVEPARSDNTDNLPFTSMHVLDQYFDAAGREINNIESVLVPSEAMSAAGGDFAAALRRQGIFWVSLYQPAERFWLFQAIETTIFLALAAALVALAYLVVRRRDA